VFAHSSINSPGVNYAVVDDLTKQLLEALIVIRLALDYRDKSETSLAVVESAKALADEAIKAAVKEGLTHGLNEQR
jgi:hypothetical protein